MDVGRLITGLFGPQSPGSLVVSYSEILLLLGAASAVRRGRQIYLGVVAGVALTLYAQMANGFIDSSLDSLLRALGLVAAALILAFDIVFEPGARA